MRLLLTCNLVLVAERGYTLAPAKKLPGAVVEDFGDDTGLPVDVGGHHIADAARRLAVSLDNGDFVFVDDTDIVADKADPAALKIRAAQDRND
ncbi:hypothetical protein [Mycolicibacterium setense]